MTDLLNIIQRFYKEIWTEGNEYSIHELIHPSYHPQDVEMPEKGPALLIKETRYFRSIFTGLKYSVLDYNIKDDSEIWVRYKIEGIHSSVAWGFQPTGKKIEGTGIGIFTIKNNQIIDQVRIYSLYDLFTSSGAVPYFWELANELTSNS